MWIRLFALVRKELLVFLQDPRARLVVLLPPLVQLFVFAHAATFDLDHVPLGVLDRDRTAPARALVAHLRGSPSFEVVELASEAAMRRAIDQRRVVAVLHLREGFGQALASGRRAVVQLLLDGRQSNTALGVATYVQRIVADFRPAGGEGGRVRLAVRAWFNPNLESRWFIVPGLVAMITMVSVMGVTGLSIARERELGTLEQLMVTPLRPFEIALGKVLPGLLVGMFEAALVGLAAVIWFGVPLRGSLPLLAAALVLFALAVAGVGLAISAFARTQQQAIVGIFLFLAPAAILSGFATPIANMPDWLQLLTLLDPLRYMMVVVRGVFLRALGIETLLPQLWPMAVLALASLVFAALTFRRRLG